MAFTSSGREYGLIDKLLATGQTTKPSSGRLKRLRKDLVKDQIGEQNDMADESRRQERRTEDLSDYGAKLQMQDQFNKEEEKRKKRLSQSGITPKISNF